MPTKRKAAKSRPRPFKKRVTAGGIRAAEAESNAVGHGRTDDNQDVSQLFPPFARSLVTSLNGTLPPSNQSQLHKDSTFMMFRWLILKSYNRIRIYVLLVAAAAS